MSDDSSRPSEVGRTYQKGISERARDALQEAIDRGDFDHLPGHGKPIDLTTDDNPFVPEDSKLSFRILRNAGFAVPWIEARKDIDRQRAKLDRDVNLHEARAVALKNSLERAPAYLRAARKNQLTAERKRSIDFLTKSAIALNRKIDDYNLMVPSTSVQTRRVDLKDILTRIDEHFAGNA